MGSAGCPEGGRKRGLLRAAKGPSARARAGGKVLVSGTEVCDRPADVRDGTRGHGRLKRRELWLFASAARGADLQAADGWPGLRLCGRRCRLLRLSQPEAGEEQEVLWAAGGSPGGLARPRPVRGLRGPWESENRLSWGRAVCFSEDRLPGRKGGPGLSVMRTLALTLIKDAGVPVCGRWGSGPSARADRGLGRLSGQWRTGKPCRRPFGGKDVPSGRASPSETPFSPARKSATLRRQPAAVRRPVQHAQEGV